MSTSFIRRLIVLAILSITLRRLLWLGRPHHNYMHHMRLYTEGQHRHQHHPQWDEWFRPLNELMVYANNDAKTAADNNRTQFESMWNHSLTHTPPGSQKYLIMYYHVMKTGKIKKKHQTLCSTTLTNRMGGESVESYSRITPQIHSSH